MLKSPLCLTVRHSRRCETACFGLPNGSFCGLKRAVWEAKTPRFRTQSAAWRFLAWLRRKMVAYMQVCRRQLVAAGCMLHTWQEGRQAPNSGAHYRLAWHHGGERKCCRKMPGKRLCAATIIDLGQNQARFSPFGGVRPLPNRAIVIPLQSKTRASRRKGRKATGRQPGCGRPHVNKRTSLTKVIRL